MARRGDGGPAGPAAGAGCRVRRLGRVLLGRVRRARLAAGLLRRPRRAGRRRAQGGGRPRPADGGSRALLPARLFRSAPGHHGLPAGVLARARSRRVADGARQRRRRRAVAPVGHDLRSRGRLPRLVRPARKRLAAAARRRAARERPDQPLDDGAPLRREHAYPARPVRAARDRRRPRPGGARDRVRRAAPERGPSCARGARARGPPRGARRGARGRARRGPQAGRLHDAHAGSGRQRELSARAVPRGVRRARRPARSRPRARSSTCAGSRPARASLA